MLALHHLDYLLFDVLTLEDGGEVDEGVDLARAVHHHTGDVALGIEAVLMGSRHHSAAVEATLHSGREPCLFKLEPLAVDLNHGIGGLVVEEQTLDGDRGVVDWLVGLLLLPVALLAAIAVDAVAYAVDELARLALYGNGGQIGYVLVYLRGSVAGLFLKVVPKVVAAARREIEHLVFDIVAVRVVDEVVECAVAAAQTHLVVGSDALEERVVALKGDYIDELEVAILPMLLHLFGALKTRAVV